MHFRYVQALPWADVVTAQAVTDVITLVTCSLLLYRNSFEDLAAGDISVEKARANLAAQMSEPK